MPDKPLAERAAEYQLRRGLSLMSDDIADDLEQEWTIPFPEQLAAYVAAESECEQLRAENASLRAALRRLGQIEGHDARDNLRSDQ